MSRRGLPPCSGLLPKFGLRRRERKTLKPRIVGSRRFQSRKRTTIFAHRGASAYAPEHTIPAYDLAIEMGADFIELDLRMTRDGVLVAFHDSSLFRTTRNSVQPRSDRVRDMTLDQIREADVGSWFNEQHARRADLRYAGLPVPTLEEVFQRYGSSTRYYIEPKDPESAPGIELELLRVMRKHGVAGDAEIEGRVLIQSFSRSSLRLIHGMKPELPLVQLLHGVRRERLLAELDLIAEYAIAIGPLHKIVDPRLVEAAHDRDLAVHPYTVNTLGDMMRVLSCGVDGVFTDDPAKLLGLIEPSALPGFGVSAS